MTSLLVRRDRTAIPNTGNMANAKGKLSLARVAERVRDEIETFAKCTYRKVGVLLLACITQIASD